MLYYTVNSGHVGRVSCACVCEDGFAVQQSINNPIDGLAPNPCI